MSVSKIVIGLLGFGLLVGACLGDTEVRFGPPGELRRPTGSDSEGACPIPDESQNPAVCPEWTDILQILSINYGCADAICHGPDARPPLIDAADPSGTYEILKEYKTDDGRPYVSDNPDDDPWLMCNLSENPNVIIGAFMPKGNFTAVTGDNLVTIGQWVACGMQKSGGTAGTGGAGGGGSTTGAGGAGGN
jgi:hypothetical protein